MKHLIFCLLLPVLTMGQTVHHEEDKIIYKGSEKLNINSQSEVLSRLQQVFPYVAEKITDSTTIHTTEGMLEASGSIRLNTPYHIIRKFHFMLQLIPKDGGYDYKVDSFYVTERQRGSKEKQKTAAEMIEGLEETGNAAIELEILLNEIDLRIQKLLTVLKNEMVKRSAGTTQSATALPAGDSSSKE